MTCNIINDHQVKFGTLFEKFEYRAVELGFNFGNQPSFWETIGGITYPLPASITPRETVSGCFSIEKHNSNE